jgi:predicted ATPase/class 3 adenylate cyclase
MQSPNQGIANWLRELGLEEHAPAFARNRIDAELLPEISDADLRELGVTALGDRKKLRRAIEALADVRGGSDAVGSGVAERRQLTLLFCDLVDSTALSTRLDPEELRDVVRAYQEACVDSIRRYDGFVAKYLGDGVLAYFGYPRAQEDAPERGVRAGLAVVEAVGELSPVDGDALRVRVGVATGEVVVGELIGEDSARERSVLGETPNLAARLQGLASPNAVVISEATHRLVGAAFECVDLGEQEVKGLAAPVRVFRADREAVGQSRFEAAHGESLTDLVGRVEDRALLTERWQRAADGDGQVVLLSGEPGIGKSRLARELRESIARGPHAIAQLQCSPYHTSSSLYPVTRWIANFAGIAPEDETEVRLERLEGLIGQESEDRVPSLQVLASLLSVPFEERYGPLTLLPAEQLDQTLGTVCDLFSALARERPLLILVEDVHWLDPTTKDLLAMIVDRAATKPILLLLTARPEFDTPWTAHGHLTMLRLNRLSRRQCEALAVAAAGETRLTSATIEAIVAKTDGVPLFVEELTAALVESKLRPGQRVGPGQRGAPLIPETLRDSLMARLDNLGPARDVAQLGSVAGREFSYGLLEAVCTLPDESLRESLDALSAAGLVFGRGVPPASTYVFKHALVQEAAYESLLKSRRRELHEEIADALESGFSEIVDAEPELLAHHRSESGQLDEASAYWLTAGRRASARSAYGEAIEQLTRGVELVRSLPPTDERLRRELDFHLALGPVLMATEGLAAHEAGEIYLRARELCREVGDRHSAFDAAWGLWLVHQQRGELREAQALTEEMLALVDQQTASAFQIQAHHAAWTTKLFTGDLVECRQHALSAVDLYDIDQHRTHAVLYGGHDPLTCAHTTLSEAVCLLGYPDLALDHAMSAVHHAAALAHPFSASMAHYFVAQLHQNRLEPGPTLEWAQRSVELSADHGFKHFLARARILVGWAMSMEDDIEGGIAEIESGLEALAETGSGMRRSYYLALLAEALGRAGRTDSAIQTVETALEAAEQTGERRWTAETHRLRGILLLARNPQETSIAETSLVQAISLARSQGARLIELRASLDLARCRADAEMLKTDVRRLYESFDEGLTTPDLVSARAALEALDAPCNDA